VNKMGCLTEYLKGKAVQKERIIKYLKKRKEGMWELLQIKFKETGEINPVMLESYFVYKAVMSDIKNDRLD